MNKLIFSFVCLLFCTQLAISQDSAEFYKRSKKAFDKYQQSGENGKLEEALDNIQKAIIHIDKEEEKITTKVWMKTGEIYNEIALNDYKIFLVNNLHQPIHPFASIKAYEAFVNATKFADKKWDINKALDELLKTATFISNEGIVAYNIEEYEKAYQSFKTIIEIKDFLDKYEHTSILNKSEEFNEHIFRTALAASKANYSSKAIENFEKLKNSNFKNPAIYSGLYSLYVKVGKQNEATSVLQNGRELFPEDEGLMIVEINQYLENGQLNNLITKLEEAINKNPSNISLYSTLGHVYNELQKIESEKGNFNLSKSYFDQSLKYFSKALEMNDTYAPALYNIGALYFNNAAIITKEIKSIETDHTATGIRTASALRSEMISYFDKALPFFQKAEAVNPNDSATLSALKEIYSRKKDDVLVNEFQARLEIIQSGNKIENGYFNQ
jgi:tetratricopeptide (TPR) repeat protein